MTYTQQLKHIDRFLKFKWGDGVIIGFNANTYVPPKVLNCKNLIAAYNHANIRSKNFPSFSPNTFPGDFLSTMGQRGWLRPIL